MATGTYYCLTRCSDPAGSAVHVRPEPYWDAHAVLTGLIVFTPIIPFSAISPLLSCGTPTQSMVSDHHLVVLPRTLPSRLRLRGGLWVQSLQADWRSCMQPHIASYSACHRGAIQQVMQAPHGRCMHVLYGRAHQPCDRLYKCMHIARQAGQPPNPQQPSAGSSPAAQQRPRPSSSPEAQQPSSRSSPVPAAPAAPVSRASMHI
jgi:hypothetical protein